MSDPVFKAEGHEETFDGILQKDKWYFWDETSANAHGPYDSEEEARRRLTVYGELLDSQGLKSLDEDEYVSQFQTCTEQLVAAILTAADAIQNFTTDDYVRANPLSPEKIYKYKLQEIRNARNSD